MQAKSITALMFWLILSGSALPATAAPLFLGNNGRPAVRRFVASAYSVYAQGIKEHGVAGLQKVTSPDFTLSLDGKDYKGQEAFAALEQPLKGLQDGVFYVNIPKVTLTKNTAVALTVETVGRRLDPETTVATTRYWTQTWRKTPQGWRLEASAQRPPEIKGPAPIMTHSFGSSPDTPLTLNTTALGTDLGTPPASGPVRDLYDPYLDALKRHDEVAFRSLLTPGFTCTDSGKVLSRQASLKLIGQIHGLMREYPGYYLTVNKFFVKPTTAAALVEERFQGTGKDADMSGIYFWMQHWVKTAQGWRLDNITRAG